MGSGHPKHYPTALDLPSQKEKIEIHIFSRIKFKMKIFYLKTKFLYFLFKIKWKF